MLKSTFRINGAGAFLGALVLVSTSFLSLNMGMVSAMNTALSLTAEQTLGEFLKTNKVEAVNAATQDKHKLYLTIAVENESDMLLVLPKHMKEQTKARERLSNIAGMELYYADTSIPSHTFYITRTS